jgi:hypothetical protein
MDAQKHSIPRGLKITIGKVTQGRYACELIIQAITSSAWTDSKNACATSQTLFLSPTYQPQGRQAGSEREDPADPAAAR